MFEFILRHDKIFAIILVVLFCILLSGCVLTEQSTQNYTVQDMIDNEYIKIDDEYHIYTKDVLSEELAEKYVSLIREDLSLVGTLYKNDYYIVLTDEINATASDADAAEYVTQSNIAGITFNDEKIIMLKYDRIQDALLHEIGHAIDNTYGFSQTEELKSFYERCGQECYYTATEKEFFAETYSMYVLGMLNNSGLGKEMNEYFNKLTTDAIIN